MAVRCAPIFFFLLGLCHHFTALGRSPLARGHGILARDPDLWLTVGHVATLSVSFPGRFVCISSPQVKQCYITACLSRAAKWLSRPRASNASERSYKHSSPSAASLAGAFLVIPFYRLLLAHSALSSSLLLSSVHQVFITFCLPGEHVLHN